MIKNATTASRARVTQLADKSKSVRVVSSFIIFIFIFYRNISCVSATHAFTEIVANTCLRWGPQANFYEDHQGQVHSILKKPAAYIDQNSVICQKWFWGWLIYG